MALRDDGTTGQGGQAKSPVGAEHHPGKFPGGLVVFVDVINRERGRP